MRAISITLCLALKVLYCDNSANINTYPHHEPETRSQTESFDTFPEDCGRDMLDAGQSYWIGVNEQKESTGHFMEFALSAEGERILYITDGPSDLLYREISIVQTTPKGYSIRSSGTEIFDLRLSQGVAIIKRVKYGAASELLPLGTRLVCTTQPAINFPRVPGYLIGQE